jgi:hypothetical protein
MHHPTHPLDPDDHDREDDYEDAELDGIEPLYQSPGLTVRPLTAEQARRLVDRWTRDPATRPRAYTTTPPLAPAPSQPDGPAWPDGAARPGASYSSPGASAHAQYRRLRAAEWADWTRGLGWRLATTLAAGLGAWLLGGLLGLPPGSRPVTAVLVTIGVGWRLRFRASAEARAWRRGAAGERRTARLLRRLERDGYVSLHDLAVRESAANIDHLVIGPTGVFVVDSKQYRGRVHQSLDGRAWHNHAPLARQLEVVAWEAATIARVLGVRVDPLVCVHGAEVAYGGLIAGGVAIVPAARLRGALGVDLVLSATEVGVLAAMAQTRLRAAA